MPLYRPSELFGFLRERGLRPLRSLSQHFLVDGNVLNRIAQLADLKGKEPVLEIGPGPGVLTEHLSERSCPVLAIEMDAGFAALIGRFSGVIGIHGDALRLDLPALVQEHFPHSPSLRVISCLPYRRTSAFLRRLLPAGSWIKSLTLVMPSAVFAKISRKPSEHWLALAAKTFCRSATAVKVSRRSFAPIPNCDSTLVHWQLQCLMGDEEGQAYLRWLADAMRPKKRAKTTSITDDEAEEPRAWLRKWRIRASPEI